MRAMERGTGVRALLPGGPGPPGPLRRLWGRAPSGVASWSGGRAVRVLCRRRSVGGVPVLRRRGPALRQWAVRALLAGRARPGAPRSARGPLEALHGAIVAAPQPYSAQNWLRSAASAKILAELAATGGPVTHEVLDASSPRQGADFLRHLLVANGVLEPRDEGLVRLESWVGAKLETIDDAEWRRLLRSYARWRLLHRARRRSAGSSPGQTPIAHAKTYLNAATALLAFLGERRRDLADCTQADVDAWVLENPGAHEARDFLDWALDRELLDAVVLPGRAPRQGRTLDDDSRWATLQRLLHDEDLDLTDRVAGCLVLAYGQQLTRIVAITRDQLNIADEVAHLQLGPTRIEVPEPLRGLLARLASEGRRYVGTGSPQATPWPFPGLSPGRPLGASHLGERLRRLDIPTMAGRRAALMHLGARLPAAVLADLLGITPSTAVRWVRAAGGDWTTYAAQVVRDGESRTTSNSNTRRRSGELFDTV